MSSPRRIAPFTQQELNESRERLIKEIIENHFSESLYLNINIKVGDACSSKFPLDRTPIKEKIIAQLNVEIQNSKDDIDETNRSISHHSLQGGSYCHLRIKRIDFEIAIYNSLLNLMKEYFEKNTSYNEEKLKSFVKSSSEKIISIIKNSIKKSPSDSDEKKRAFVISDSSLIYNPNLDIEKYLKPIHDYLDKTIPRFPEIIPDDKEMHNIFRTSPENGALMIGGLMLKIIKFYQDHFTINMSKFFHENRIPISPIKTNQAMKNHLDYMFSDIEKLHAIFNEYKEGSEKIRHLNEDFGNLLIKLSHKLLKCTQALKQLKDQLEADNVTSKQKIELFKQAYNLFGQFYRAYESEYEDSYLKSEFIKHKIELITIDRSAPIHPGIEDKYISEPIINLDHEIQSTFKNRNPSLYTKRLLAYINEQVELYYATPVRKNSDVLKELMYRISFAQRHDSLANYVLGPLKQSIMTWLGKEGIESEEFLTEESLVLHPSYVNAKRYMSTPWIVRTPKGRFLEREEGESAKYSVFPDCKEEAKIQPSKVIARVQTAETLLKVDDSKKPERDAMVHMLRKALIPYQDSKGKNTESFQELVLTILYVNHRIPYNKNSGGLFMGIGKITSPRIAYWNSLKEDLLDLFESDVLKHIGKHLCTYQLYKTVHDKAEKNIFLCNLIRDCREEHSITSSSMTSYFMDVPLEFSSQISEKLTSIIQLAKLNLNSDKNDNLSSLAFQLKDALSICDSGRSDGEFTKGVKSFFHKLTLYFCKQYPDIWYEACRQQVGKKPSPGEVSAPSAAPGSKRI